MKVERLPPGAPVVAFGSAEARYQIVGRLPEGAVGVITLAPRGHVGMHEAPLKQQMVVVAGAGWVQGKDGEQVPLAVGDVATFEAGEAHATLASAAGLTVLVIEGVR